MKHDEALDSALREKLRAAAAEELPEPASEALQAQLVQRLVEEQGRLRARKKLHLWGGSLGAVAAAAAVIWALPRAEPTPKQEAVTQRCALPVHPQLQQEGAPHLSLGSLGMLVGSEDAEISVQSADACVLRVRLQRGTLAGDLHNLRPAELRIETPQAEVVVRGTRFSVAADQWLEVVLLSGKVDVESESSSVTLAPQQVLRKAADGQSISTVNQRQREQLESLLRKVGKTQQAVVQDAPDPVATVDEIKVAPRKGAAELLFQAERERKSGAFSRARRLYAQASEFREENGEVALLRWARLELSEGQAKRATELLSLHERRFKPAKLGAEAAWLEIEALRALGRVESARQQAESLLEKYPHSPQADAARAWLEKR